MNIYFGCKLTGDITGGKDKALVVETLKELGHVVLSEIFLQNELQKKGKTAQEIYERDIAWVEEADIMIADVSQPSLGLGYEIGWLTAKNRRVVALCKQDKFDQLTPMIKGCTEPSFSLHTWQTKEDLVQTFKKELI